MTRKSKKAIEAPGTMRLTVKGLPALWHQAAAIDAAERGETKEDLCWSILMDYFSRTMARLEEMREKNVELSDADERTNTREPSLEKAGDEPDSSPAFLIIPSNHPALKG